MFTPTPPTPHRAPLALPVSEETVADLRVPATDDDATRRVLVDDGTTASDDFGPADDLDLDRDSLFASAQQPQLQRYGSLIAATAASDAGADEATVERELGHHGARTYAGSLFSPTPPGWATNDPHAAPTRERLLAAELALDVPLDTPTPRVAAPHCEPDTSEELAPPHDEVVARVAQTDVARVAQTDVARVAQADVARVAQTDGARALELSAPPKPPLPPLPALITPTPTPAADEPQPAIPPPLPSLVMRGLHSGGVRPADERDERGQARDDGEPLTIDDDDAAEGPTLIDHGRRSAEVGVVPGMPQPPCDDSAPLAGFTPLGLAPHVRRRSDDGSEPASTGASLRGSQSVPSLASLQRQARTGMAGQPVGAPPTLLPDLTSSPARESNEAPLRVIAPAPIVALASPSGPRRTSKHLQRPSGSARRARGPNLRWIWLAAGVLVVGGGAVTGALVRHSSSSPAVAPNDLVNPRGAANDHARATTPKVRAQPAHAAKAAASRRAPTSEPAGDATPAASAPRRGATSTRRTRAGETGKAPTLIEARTLLQRGLYRAAHRAFNALLDKRAGYEPALIGRARAAVELDLEQPLLALDGSQRAQTEARVLRARVQVRRALREHDPPRAIRATRSLLALPRSLKRDARVQLWLGELLVARERYLRARRVLENLLARHVDLRRAPTVHVGAMVVLSRLRLATDHRTAATIVARRALDLARRRDLAPALVAACQSQLRRCRRARRAH